MSKPDLANPLEVCEIAEVQNNDLESNEILEAALEGASITLRELQDSQFFPLTARLEFLKRLENKLSEQSENIARVLSGEIALPLDLARAEISQSIEALKQLIQNPLESAEDSSGIHVLLSAFNSPILLPLQELARSWIQGVPVLWKPSSKAALSALCLADFIHAEALPPGFFALLHMQKEVVSIVINDPRVSTVTVQCALEKPEDFPSRQTIKNKNLVKFRISESHNESKKFATFSESDDFNDQIQYYFEKAFDFAGQRRDSLKNLYVPPALYQKVLRTLNEKTAELSYGNTSGGFRVGPMINTAAVEKIRFEKARLLNSGAQLSIESKNCEALYEPNWAVAPMIFHNLAKGDSWENSKILGPLLAVHTLD